MVGLGRVELPTSPLSGVRSNQLSYRPEFELAATGSPAAPGKNPHSSSKKVSRTWLNALGGYAADDHRGMADRAKKAQSGLPQSAVRDGKLQG